MRSCILQGESTLHSSTPQENSAYTAVAASTSEDSDTPHDPSRPSSHEHTAEGTWLSLTAGTSLLLMAQHFADNAHFVSAHIALIAMLYSIPVDVIMWC